MVRASETLWRTFNEEGGRERQRERQRERETQTETEGERETDRETEYLFMIIMLGK